MTFKSFSHDTDDDPIVSYFHDETRLISNWRTIMCTTDTLWDPYFLVKNSHNFPNLHVHSIGLKLANGIYKLVGTEDNVGKYSNGLFEIYRES
jgi:hypothetical protein